jgi:hypothetical protein
VLDHVRVDAHAGGEGEVARRAPGRRRDAAQVDEGELAGEQGGHGAGGVERRA